MRSRAVRGVRGALSRRRWPSALFRRLRPAWVILALVAVAACGSPAPRVRITLAPASSSTSPTATAPTDSVAIVGTPSPTPVAVSGTFQVTVVASLSADVLPALRALQAQDPSLRVNADTTADADSAAKAGADFAVERRLPGAAAPAGAIVARRRPVALMLPFTASPDDLTLAQALDVISGVTTNLADVGGPPRPIRLAFSDPSTLASAGNLANRTAFRVAAGRTDTAATLAAEIDAGADELAVLPWPGLRLHSKAIRIDHRYPSDADYPLSDDVVLVPLTRAGQQAVQPLAAALAAQLSGGTAGTATIDAVGDLMLARGVAAQAQRYGESWPYQRVSDRLKSADLRFGNLELSLTDRGVQAHKDYTFRAPPAAATGLTAAGFNLVDVANNHVLDYGAQGLLDTFSALASAGVLHVGGGSDTETAHAPVITEVHGLRIAWLAYVNVPNDSITGFVARSLDAGPGRPGVAWGTADAVSRDVAAAKQRADVVIVALHSGFEYTSEPNSVQRDLAHAAIDAGAALVLGAHPHVLQGVEFYKSGVIAYSLGNFVFDLDESDRAHFGLPSVLTGILRVSLDKSGVTGLEFYPAIINSADFRPEPVFGDAAKPVYQRLYQLTDALRGSWH